MGRPRRGALAGARRAGMLRPIVPKSSIAGRSLAAVVAIMTFLAALTTGAVMMVVSAASDWQSDVGREVTIQVRPVPGRDIEADVRKAADIARAAPGIAEVRAYTKEESARLVEPWLGAGPGARGPADSAPDRGQARCPARAGFRRLCARRSRRRCRPRASTIIAAGSTACAPWRERRSSAGIAVLALVLAVTVLSVTFATRGAMATNRPDRRSAALCRRHRQLHRRPIPAPFPDARLQGRRDRRRRGDPAVRLHGGGKRLACRHAGRR